MYHLTICDPERRERSRRIYNDLHNALSDLFTGHILEFVDIECDPAKPKLLTTGGTMENGFDDEFCFKYDNGFSVTIGILIVEDAKPRITD